MSTEELTGHALLESARARKAERDKAARAALPVKPGDTIHALKTGVTFATGQGFISASHVSRAGENYVVTQKIIDASYSNSGRSWLAHLVSDEAQIAAWGEVRFGLGQAPADAPTWNVRGDADWTQQRDLARSEAWNQPTLEGRNAALAAMNKRFGPAPSTTTYSRYTDPTIAAAEAQQKALNEGGVRFAQHVEAKEAGARR